MSRLNHECNLSKVVFHVRYDIKIRIQKIKTAKKRRIMTTRLKMGITVVVCFGIAGCGETDLGSRLAASKIAGNGLAAESQTVSGAAILMKPRVEDLTTESFNIRYIEIGFGTGTPASVRDLAVNQCAEFGKKAVFKAASRGIVQLNTVKAYYKCV